MVECRSHVSWNPLKQYTRKADFNWYIFLCSQYLGHFKHNTSHTQIVNTYEFEHFGNPRSWSVCYRWNCYATSSASGHIYTGGLLLITGARLLKSFIKPHKTPALMWSGPLQNKRVSWGEHYVDRTAPLAFYARNCCWGCYDLLIFHVTQNIFT